LIPSPATQTLPSAAAAAYVAMLYDSAAILRLCNAVLSNWPGPAPLPRSRDPAAILSTRLQDRVQAPKLKPAEVHESLRGSAVEALAVADKLVFVLYNEVLIRPGGVDVTRDADLKE
jgi:hypothetical protein